MQTEDDDQHAPQPLLHRQLRVLSTQVTLANR